jgi:hypothetical protein
MDHCSASCPDSPELAAGGTIEAAARLISRWGNSAADEVKAPAISSIPPLHWWREVPINHLGPRHEAALKRSLRGLYLLDETRWPDAVAGDAASAVAVALDSVRHSVEPTPRLDLIASAILRCALAGDPAARMVLDYLRCRLARFRAHSGTPEGDRPGSRSRF